MKQLFLILAIVSFSFAQQSRAALFLPHLADVRLEITSQLAIASNAPVLDKKLVTALRKSLTLIDRPGKTNVANDLKTLGLVAKTLNRTTVSNEFQNEFTAAIDEYFLLLSAAATSGSNRLNATYPGRLRESAAKALEKVFAAILDASVYSDLPAEAKLLSKIATSIVRAEAAIARAENAPAPPASITARITGSLNTTIKTQGAGIVAGDGLVLNGAQAMGAGFKQINLVCLAVPEGTHTVNVQNGSINTLQFPGIAVNFGNGVGTATVTRNNANRTAFGTFTFTATGVSGTTGTITVTGEFTGTF
jgi:hypothetical protein